MLSEENGPGDILYKPHGNHTTKFQSWDTQKKEVKKYFMSNKHEKIWILIQNSMKLLLFKA